MARKLDEIWAAGKKLATVSEFWDVRESLHAAEDRDGTWGRLSADQLRALSERFQAEADRYEAALARAEATRPAYAEGIVTLTERGLAAQIAQARRARLVTWVLYQYAAKGKAVPPRPMGSVYAHI